MIVASEVFFLKKRSYFLSRLIDFLISNCTQDHCIRKYDWDDCKVEYQERNIPKILRSLQVGCFGYNLFFITTTKPSPVSLTFLLRLWSLDLLWIMEILVYIRWINGYGNLISKNKYHASSGKFLVTFFIPQFIPLNSYLWFHNNVLFLLASINMISFSLDLKTAPCKFGVVSMAS